MSFLFEYSGFPRRPIPGDPGPFPRFHARLAEAEALLAWGVADERAPGERPAEGPDGLPGRRPDDRQRERRGGTRRGALPLARLRSALRPGRMRARRASERRTIEAG